MTYDGNKVISWAECLWRPDGAHLIVAGDWYVTNPDRTDQIDAARYLWRTSFGNLKSKLSGLNFHRMDFGDLQKAFDDYQYKRSLDDLNRLYRLGIDKPKDGT